MRIQHLLLQEIVHKLFQAKLSISDLVVEGENIQWYDSPENGNLLDDLFFNKWTNRICNSNN